MDPKTIARRSAGVGNRAPRRRPHGCLGESFTLAPGHLAQAGAAWRLVPFVALGLLLSYVVLRTGNVVVGPEPHAYADGSVHRARLNVVLVGRTRSAQRHLLGGHLPSVDHAEPMFCVERVIGGLTSGEGLVAELAERPDGPGRHVLVMESEFARLLRVSARSASLSALLREAWDGGDLAILTRKQPLRVTNAMKEAGAAGLDGSEQRDLFNRHLAGARLAAARAELHAHGLAYTITIDTGGRPRIVIQRLVSYELDPPRPPTGVWSLSSLHESPETGADAAAILSSDNREVPEPSDD
ncbi:MAG: hypothetical protein JWM72_3465 [Actinomycetia bacterium]|nr:hypothetical protein [Actinomycetes bacterium]